MAHSRRDFLKTGSKAALGGAILLKSGKLLANLDHLASNSAEHFTGDWQNHATRKALAQNIAYVKDVVTGDPDFLLFSGFGQGRKISFGDRTFLANASNKEAHVTLSLPERYYGYTVVLPPGASTVPENLLMQSLYALPGPAVIEVRVDGVPKDQVKIAAKTIGWNPDLLGTIGVTSPRFNPNDLVSTNLFGNTTGFTCNAPVLDEEYLNLALYSPKGAVLDLQAAIGWYSTIVAQNVYIEPQKVIQLSDILKDSSTGFVTGTPFKPLTGKDLTVVGFAKGDLYGMPIIMNSNTGDGFGDKIRSIAMSSQFSSMYREDIEKRITTQHNSEIIGTTPRITAVSENTAKEMKQSMRTLGNGTGQQHEVWVSGYCEGIEGNSGAFQTYLGLANQGNNAGVFSQNIITAYLSDGRKVAGVASILAGRRYVFDDVLKQLGVDTGVAALHIVSDYGMQVDAHTLNSTHNNVGERNAYWTLDDMITPGNAGLLASVGETGDAASNMGAITNLQFFVPPEYSTIGANVNVTAYDNTGKLVGSKNVYVPSGRHTQFNVRNILGIPQKDEYFTLRTELRSNSPFFASSTRIDNASKDWTVEVASLMKG